VPMVGAAAMLEVRMSATARPDTTEVTAKRKSTSAPRCLAATVEHASMKFRVSVASVTTGSRARCVSWMWTSAPVIRVGMAEPVGTSSAATSAPVLRARLDFGVRRTLTTVPPRHAATEEHVGISSEDLGASVFPVLPGVSARRTSTNVCRSHAPGPVRSAASSVIRVPGIPASAWTAGLGLGARHGRHDVALIRAAMADCVWNRQLADADVLRYFDVSRYHRRRHHHHLLFHYSAYLLFFVEAVTHWSSIPGLSPVTRSK